MTFIREIRAKNKAARIKNGDQKGYWLVNTENGKAEFLNEQISIMSDELYDRLTTEQNLQIEYRYGLLDVDGKPVIADHWKTEAFIRHYENAYGI